MARALHKIIIYLFRNICFSKLITMAALVLAIVPKNCLTLGVFLGMSNDVQMVYNLLKQGLNNGFGVELSSIHWVIP